MMNSLPPFPPPYDQLLQVPPKPWLMSSFGALLQDKEMTQFWKSIWSVAKTDPHWRSRLQHFFRYERMAPDENEEIQSDAIFFPRPDASHDAKCAWLGVVYNEWMDNNRYPIWDPRFVRDNMPTNIGPIVKELLYETCPDTVSVQILVDRKRIDHFLRLVGSVEEDKEEEKEEPLLLTSFGLNDMQDPNSEHNRQMAKMKEQEEKRYQVPGLQDAKKLLSSPYLRDDLPQGLRIKRETDSEGISTLSNGMFLDKLASLRIWLKTLAPPGTSVHQEAQVTKLPPGRKDDLGGRSLYRNLDDQDLVLLAKGHGIPKGANTDEILAEMSESLGLDQDAVCYHITDSRTKYIPGIAYQRSEKVGENIHFRDKDGTQTVSFTWLINHKLTRKNKAGKERSRRLHFSPLLIEAKAEKEASQGMLTCITFPKEPTEYEAYQEDVQEMTQDNTHILWLPGDFKDIENRVYNHCVYGEGEVEVIKKRLEQGTTDSGNLFWDLIHLELSTIFPPFLDGREFKSLHTVYSWMLCHLLALVRTVAREKHYLGDHENSEEHVKGFFERFADIFRAVLGQTNETLGLGRPNELPELRSKSREALYAMLEFYSNSIETALESVGIPVCFNCIPGNDGVNEEGL